MFLKEKNREHASPQRSYSLNAKLANAIEQQEEPTLGPVVVLDVEGCPAYMAARREKTPESYFVRLLHPEHGPLLTILTEADLIVVASQ